MRFHIDFQRIRTLWTMPQSGLVANVDCKWIQNFGIWLWLNQKGCLNYDKNASIQCCQIEPVPMHYFIMHCHPLDVKFNITETSAILKRLGFQVSDHSIPFLILDDFQKKSHEIIGRGQKPSCMLDQQDVYICQARSDIFSPNTEPTKLGYQAVERHEVQKFPNQHQLE